MKTIDKKVLTEAIGTIGYEIIDIIAEACDIKEIFFADLYLVDMRTYTDGEKQEDKIIKEIYKKYKLAIPTHKDGKKTKTHYEISSDWSIALIVLHILEEKGYKSRKYK